MKIVRDAVAGTLDSSDVLVKIGPGRTGCLDIHVRSEVMRQFGERIREVAAETLASLQVGEADVAIDDKGALDCVIRARVQAAVLRAAESDALAWEKLG